MDVFHWKACAPLWLWIAFVFFSSIDTLTCSHTPEMTMKEQSDAALQSASVRSHADGAVITGFWSFCVLLEGSLTRSQRRRLNLRLGDDTLPLLLRSQPLPVAQFSSEHCSFLLWFPPTSSLPLPLLCPVSEQWPEAWERSSSLKQKPRIPPPPHPPLFHTHPVFLTTFSCCSSNNPAEDRGGRGGEACGKREGSRHWLMISNDISHEGFLHRALDPKPGKQMLHHL